MERRIASLLGIVQTCDARMTRKQKHPAVVLLEGEYPIGVSVSVGISQETSVVFYIQPT